MLRVISLWIGIVIPFLSLSAQPERAITDFKTIQSMVDSNRFEMVFTIATTHNTFFLQPTTSYSDQNIRIGQDSAFVIIRDSIAAGYLPYFGSGYSIPQIGEKGIIFSNKMQEQMKSVKGKGRRQSISYQFAVVGRNDSYKVSIDIRYDGMCYLYINSLRRSPISYVGQIVNKVE